jgi:hypothetical protein
VGGREVREGESDKAASAVRSTLNLQLSRLLTLGMPSSGRLCLVTLVRTDVSEERRVSIIRVTRIGELGITLTVTRYRRSLRRITVLGIICYVPLKCWFSTRATRRNTTEDGILHSYRCNGLKSYSVF